MRRNQVLFQYATMVNMAPAGRRIGPERPGYIPGNIGSLKTPAPPAWISSRCRHSLLAYIRRLHEERTLSVGVKTLNRRQVDEINVGYPHSAGPCRQIWHFDNQAENAIKFDDNNAAEEKAYIGDQESAENLRQRDEHDSKASHQCH
ncbi:hypothetical protein CHS0354_006586 [Potamilus streckersoni]|uniref:Uncharacterized protein n=1 Tax=Potamilus streckersoni TaxID=2493646 RepID=A0AAE0SWE0_9BIVA|nr:hypothetical protein CHS0354_006586 [Potamilus streckersoni]